MILKNTYPDREARESLRNIEATVRDLRRVLNAPGGSLAVNTEPGLASTSAAEWTVEEWREELLVELRGNVEAVATIIEECGK
jgi:hypothetical protein